MRFIRLRCGALAPSLLALMIAGCGGAAGSSGSVLPSHGAATPQDVVLKIVLPAAQNGMSAHLRHALFVSASTNGLLVKVYNHGSPVLGRQPVALQAIDISATAPSSSNCVTVASGRTCTPSFAVPSGGPYDFDFQTYDAVPVAGSFAAARELGVGVSPNVIITVGVTNTVAISIGGIVASAFIVPTFQTLNGLDAAAQNVAVGALDADGHVIVTSGVGETYVDVDGNPVSIALSVSGAGTTMALTPTSVDTSGTPVSLVYTSANATSAQASGGFTATLTATPGNGATPGNINLAVERSVTEFTTGISAGAYPLGIAVGPDRNLWFTEELGNRIGRITPTGTVTEFSSGINGSTHPYGIAAGSDGNLWFTESLTSRIGRINPTTGTINEYSTGITPGCDPQGIAAGSDGNLWFTEFSGNSIGRINPMNGVITEFSTGISANAGPRGITSGPLGNHLWFTESNGDRIGRITVTTGAIAEFSTGLSANADPTAIVAGPDGNLWFTESAGTGRIGRINPTTGAITEFSTGISSLAAPDSITAGAYYPWHDGNLWFGEYGGNRIGRVNPTTGTITEFSAGISSSAHPIAGIAAGPDGNLWFTEVGSNSIGRLTP
ncbi:MAG TPA: hypothetical protein VMS32_02390 [Verrucomicrobiae bacterium]|jgi:streptogramin lyase|nr:hypothetical protein [Verrucomicrobiae bacterium]